MTEQDFRRLSSAVTLTPPMVPAKRAGPAARPPRLAVSAPRRRRGFAQGNRVQA